MHDPVPVHVGHSPPRPDDESKDQTRPAPRLGLQQYRASGVHEADVDWARREVEPRWLGFETADCVAALQPSNYSNGVRELDRFLAGAADRGETAILVSVLGYAGDALSQSTMHSRGEDGVALAHTNTYVHGVRLPARTRVTLAADIPPADQDLGKRLLNRAPDAPWWGLQLEGVTEQPLSGEPPRIYPAVGELRPVLVDSLGTPVVGVWVSPDERIRWYIVPDDINWNVVLDWLVHQAIPAYVPDAARRYRTSSFIDHDLLTPGEQDAQQGLDDMKKRHAEERQRLEADLDRARQDAKPVREGLFYGTGDQLVRAVETVLRAAGFDVVDLDAELGRTASADLLITLGDHRRLVEVKSEGRNASESLVADLLKHLRTWPELRPELPVGGGVLVVNHQHRLPPAERSRVVYRRKEFLDSLTVPVVAVHDLFDWWRTADWTAIQRTILATDPPDPTRTPQPSTVPAIPEPPSKDESRRRGGWRIGRRR